MALLGWSGTGAARGADRVGRASSSPRERRRAVRLRSSVVAMTFLLAASAAVPTAAAAPLVGGGAQPRVPPVLEHYSPHPPAPAPSPEPVAVPDPLPSPAAQPSGREVLALRSARSQTFAQSDGSYLTQLYSAPRFYRPEGSAEWAPIELAFHTPAAAAGAPDATADQGPVTLALRGPSDGAGFLALNGAGRTIRFRFPDGAVAPAAAAHPLIAASGAYAEYADVLAGGIDLRVFPRVDGVKTYLVLPSRPAQSSFTFALDAPGLTLAAQADGSLAFVDAAGATVGLIPRPFMIDSSPNTRAGAGLLSDAVHLSLGRSGATQTVTITPDPAYLLSAVYPVYLDPTVTAFPTDAGSVADTFVTNAAKTTNFNTYARPDDPYYHELWVGDDPESGHAARTFIAFPDLASVLGSAHVESAVLSLLPYHAYADAPTASRTWIRRFNTSWDAATVTWNTQPTLNTFKLMPPGDDAYADLVEGQTASFGVTNTVRAWLDGSWPNDGLAIYEPGLESDPTYWKRLIASEEAGDNGPTLTVTWHQPEASVVSPSGGGWVGSAALSWSYNDGDASAEWPETSARIEVAADEAFSSIVLDTTVATGGSHAYDATASLADGSYWWRVRVSDGLGWSEPSAGAAFALDASAPTALISSPAQDATVSGTVTLTGSATDTTFDHYSLDYGVGTNPTSWTDIGANPYTGAVVDDTLGSLDVSGLAGIYTVRLRVYDVSHTAEVRRRIRVGSGPFADLGLPLPGSYLKGARRAIVGTASGADFVSYSTSRGAGCSPSSWTPVGDANPQYSPVENGTLNYWQSNNLASGQYTVRLVTSGASGSQTATSCLTIDNSVPLALIETPAAGAVVAGELDVSGTASDDQALAAWTLEAGAGASPTSWTSVASGTSAVSAGTLGTWQSAGFEGLTTLRLTVTDLAGWSSSATRTLWVANARRGSESYVTSVPFDLGGDLALAVGVADGELTLDRTAFTIPSYGPPQSLSLHYSSAESTHAGRLGYGWISNLTQYLTAESGYLVWHRADGGIEPFGQVGGVWTPAAGHFETLEHDTGAGTYVITAKDQSQLVFADSSPYRLTAVKDRFGHALTLAWGSSSATATDVSSRASALVIDPANDRLTGVTDSAGRAWSLAYDANQQLTGLTDPEDALTTFAYDANHRLTSISRSRSRVEGEPETIVWTITYDQGGRVATIVDPEAALLDQADTFSYAEGSTSVALARDAQSSATSVYTLDPLGRVTGLTDAGGWEHSYAYDDDGNLLSETTPIDAQTAATTTSTYDDAGNRLSQIRPIDASTSVTTSWTYNATNDVTSEIDAAGTAIEQQTAYTYSDGHLVELERNPQLADGPDGQVVTSYTYTAHDQLETETDPLGRVTKHLYDSDGNEVALIRNYLSGQSVTPTRNVETDSAYDANTSAGLAGLVTSVTDPAGAVTSYTYDDLGRQLTSASAADTGVPADTTTSVYDELGNVLTSTETFSGSDPLVSAHVYDLLNCEIASTDPAGAVTTTSVDLAGHALSREAPASDPLTASYDALGRAVTEEPSASLQLQHAYDGAGNEITTTAVTDGEAVPDLTLAHSYDLAGNALSMVTDPDDLAITTSTTYDLLGRVLTSTDANGVVTANTYDRLGRLVSTTVDDLTTDTTYDKAGNRLTASEPYADGETPRLSATVYDALDRPIEQITNYVPASNDPDANLTTTTAYDLAGNPTASVDPRGIVTRSVYNDRGLVIETIADCTDSGFTPSADPANCEGAGTHDGATNVVTDTTYDGAGNVLSTTQRDPLTAVHDVVTSSAYDETGRLIEQIVDAGEGKLNLRTQYAYDAAGRQIATRDPLDTITRSIYDGLGQLTETITDCTSSGTSVPDHSSTTWMTCTGEGSADGTYNQVTASAYDDLGNVIWQSQPAGRATTFTYDLAGRRISQTDNDVAGTPNPDEDLVTTYAYDEAGHQTGVRAPDSASLRLPRHRLDLR